VGDDDGISKLEKDMVELGGYEEGETHSPEEYQAKLKPGHGQMTWDERRYTLCTVNNQLNCDKVPVARLQVS
jgi:hypothetical protein